MYSFARIKRIKHCLLACTLALVVAAGFNPLSAFAAPQASIALGTVQAEQEPSDTFTVPVTITDNPGFAAATLEIVYDHNVLELVGLNSTGALLDSGVYYDFSKRDTVGYANISSSLPSVTQDGTLFSLSFKVKQTATAGRTAYSARLYKSAPTNFVSFVGGSPQAVSVTFRQGSVTVVPADSGGTDGTGGVGTGGTGTGGAGTGGTGTGSAGTGGTGTGSAGTGGTGGAAAENDAAGNAPQTIPSTQTPTTGGGSNGSATDNGAGGSGQQVIPEVQTPLYEGEGSGAGFDFASVPWGWIALLLAVLAGGLFFFLLSRRRRKDDEERY